MTFASTSILSIVITFAIYFVLVGAVKLGGWLANNEDRKWVKYLDKLISLILRGSILFIIWVIVIRILEAIGYIPI